MSADFIFLRPWWLLALLIVPMLVVLRRSKQGGRSAWQAAVDPHLLPHLIETRTSHRNRGDSWLPPVAAVIAICALAGPSWQLQKTPLWQVDAPLVIALDLSSAMLAADLAPTRLVQARYKLMELLKQRQGGQVGLIVYAGDAFTAAPITRDAGTVQAVLGSLTADLMPVDGQRADRAIVNAVALMRSAGFTSGDILLVTDHADAPAQRAARQARTEGFSVSALGVGTEAGAPKTAATGFVSNTRGQVEFARLDLPSLTALAAQGGGNVAPLSTDSGDLKAIDLLDPRGPARRGSSPEENRNSGSAEVLNRSDDGYWLLLLLLPMALNAFRRQAVLALPLLIALGAFLRPGYVDATEVSTPEVPQGSSTTATSPHSAWASLWQRRDQRAWTALNAGDFQQARELAPDAALRGAAAYRTRDYAGAAQEFSAGNDADAHYNLGNALAEAGQYQKALAAYDEALAVQPGMADALANRKAVEDALKKQVDKPQPQGSNPQTKQEPDNSASSPKAPAAAKDTPPPSGKQPARSAGDEPAPEDSKAHQEKEKKQDAQAQQQAAEAARREMDRALAQKADGADPRETMSRAAEPSAEQREEAEHQQALQQWLRQVPDDPGGLLRRKFALEYQRRQAGGGEK